MSKYLASEAIGLIGPGVFGRSPPQSPPTFTKDTTDGVSDNWVTTTVVSGATVSTLQHVLLVFLKEMFATLIVNLIPLFAESIVTMYEPVLGMDPNFLILATWLKKHISALFVILAVYFSYRLVLSIMPGVTANPYMTLVDAFLGPIDANEPRAIGFYNIFGVRFMNLGSILMGQGIGHFFALGFLWCLNGHQAHHLGQASDMSDPWLMGLPLGVGLGIQVLLISGLHVAHKSTASVFTTGRIATTTADLQHANMVATGWAVVTLFAWSTSISPLSPFTNLLPYIFSGGVVRTQDYVLPLECLFFVFGVAFIAKAIRMFWGERLIGTWAG